MPGEALVTKEYMYFWIAVYFRAIECKEKKHENKNMKISGKGQTASFDCFVRLHINYQDYLNFSFISLRT